MSWEYITSYETLKNLGISIGIFLLFLFFKKIFIKDIFELILKLSKKTPTDFLSYVCLAFEHPARWLFVIIGLYVALGYFPFINQSDPIILKLIRSSIIALISWGLFNLSSVSSHIFTKLNERFDLKIDQILIPFLSKALQAIIIAISISIIAKEFDYDVNGFVAGLGLGGLAFALAAKDALANLFGGIVIISEKPFSIGDWIMTPSVDGTVEDINFRSTKVRTSAQALVTVPNATLANQAITNWSKMGKRQISFRLGVTYDTPKNKLERIVRKINDLLKNHEDIHPETIIVAFDQYNESSLDIFLNFFTKTTVYEEYLRVKEDINFKIMEIIEEEEVSLAFPSRTLYFDSQTHDSCR
ncbi:mechanosensitive ion channel family protein [Desulfitobacterium metallireducens]|uniref:Mechanosensitive ion channel protein n=1 Tax=Desulfitobacterium metallireducens DSM 15288 TaxID=871968 RepID=W0E9T8_9FIRM|nr:mechanosensitive ion channel family protein [Desulfitobacterium metallireducens]AHF06278.1 mechanosensitive ion channel protein [Desulfitobacterium metallireducens DSM 15288]